MSVSDNNSRRAAAKLFSRELLEFCQSDFLSEKGLRKIIERHGNIYRQVSSYQFFLEACYNERVTERVIECLLEYFSAAAKATNKKGSSPLHLVCYNKNVKLNIVQLLIDAAPDALRSVNSTGRMPLHCLCLNRKVDEVIALEILKLLIEKHPEAAQHATNQGCLPIHIASRKKNVTLDIIQLLIDAAPDSVRSVDADGDTPLHDLCRNEELDERAAMEILKLVIEKHPEAIQHVNNEGVFPIHCAGYGRKTPAFCRVLIEAYPGPERMTDVDGRLPIHYACMDNTVATLQYLYKLHPDTIHHRTTDGYCPIHYAIGSIRHRDNTRHYVDMVKFLLDCDPSVKLQKHRRKSLLYYACHLSYNDSNIEAALEIIEAIYDAYPEAIEDNTITSTIESYHQQVQSFISSQLVYARQAKDLHLMMTPDDNGQLPLHTALQNDVTLGSIKLLVKGNPSALQSPDNNDTLPLHMACQHHESSHVVQYLVEQDTTALDAVDMGGNTALHYACRGANYETIAMLMEKYGAASVSKRNARGKLPIDLLLVSDRGSERESVEYIESAFRLLKACPETLMNYNIPRQQANTAG